MKLNEPYPVRERTIGQTIIHSVAEGAFLYAFFVLFQPFDMSQWHDENKYIKLLGFAVVTTLSTFTNREILPRIFTKFYREENWVVWKEIVSIVILLLTISLGNLIYGNILFGWGFSFSMFIGSFASVMLIGFFPITFWVLMDYNLKMRKFDQNIVISHTEEKPRSVSAVRLTAENEKDFVEFNESQLLFIESSDNYSTVYLSDSGKLKKDLLRSSLSRLETQLNSEKLVRCHRSYIVNLTRVEKVSGNAQGFKFHLSDYDAPVPVARKYSYLVEGLR
ncbi:LytTR family transcriptional regulator [Emticicia sp. CRIBPO]|jgi:hypothetical protein|uniref:LytR/AlgR family response regulator transcription factor n=1 Tax=Emticicia sp. CRIBPO TaxID=2683258 RepID=UPI001412B925|nr:LytTR family transcriptional regulator DNA-binding domain-containing protein [Emticicia sp. CRIBPO]NBA87137.1 LytTR family transcriptional regulator [Emticicia sp. CRIBPO]